MWGKVVAYQKGAGVEQFLTERCDPEKAAPVLHEEADHPGRELVWI